MPAWLTPSGQHATAVLVYWTHAFSYRVESRVHIYLSDEPHTDDDAIDDAREFWVDDFTDDETDAQLLGAHVLAVNDPAN